MAYYCLNTKYVKQGKRYIESFKKQNDKTKHKSCVIENTSDNS